ncbi:MAG: LacI family DNA-binding transcriptional regulator [Nocardioidaceae bacterium]
MTPTLEGSAMPEDTEPSRPRQGPSIYDVAKAAGVAASTVSRALSRPGRVNSETAERIRRVAMELGYRAHPLPRASATAPTSMIALAISDVTNPFYFEIIRGAQAAAAEAGYTMLLADAQESDRLEREALDRAVPAVEGIVLASTRMSDSALRMIAKQRPMIVLNRSISDVPSVVTDIPRGMLRAVEHLAALGHESITYVGGPTASWTNGRRWVALREVAQELNIRARRIGPFPPTAEGGGLAVQTLGRDLPSAVLAYNDLMAIGVMRGLAAAGVQVPDDVSVVGFDNIFAAELVTPALTTVEAPLNKLGATAVQHLLAIVGGAQPRRREPVVVPTRLVQRESAGRRTR